MHQGLQDGWFMRQVVRIKLTQSLGLVTNAVVDEAISSSYDIFGQPQDWKTIRIKDCALDSVARLSSRVFLGEELTRNKAWLEISKNYTVDIFGAQDRLRPVHPLFRRAYYWFEPTCVRLRNHVKKSRELIAPEVEARRLKAEKAKEAGGKVVKESDAIAWMVDLAKDRKVDYVAGQLSLTIAAVHTTSETITNCLLQLCEAPEIVQPLRDEVIAVLSENGWAKTTLYKLKLMDSFMKETQRLHGLSFSKSHG
jgi:cytochrome P450